VVGVGGTTTTTGTRVETTIVTVRGTTIALIGAAAASGTING